MSQWDERRTKTQRMYRWRWDAILRGTTVSGAWNYVLALSQITVNDTHTNNCAPQRWCIWAVFNAFTSFHSNWKWYKSSTAQRFICYTIVYVVCLLDTSGFSEQIRSNKLLISAFFHEIVKRAHPSVLRQTNYYSGISMKIEKLLSSIRTANTPP